MGIVGGDLWGMWEVGGPFPGILLSSQWSTLGGPNLIRLSLLGWWHSDMGR